MGASIDGLFSNWSRKQVDHYNIGLLISQGALEVNNVESPFSTFGNLFDLLAVQIPGYLT